MKTALGIENVPPEFKKQLLSTVPLGRLAEPRDVAAAVTFLASDDAEFLTGVCLDVDGGRSVS
jgi:3-oxoacyl-[acyl-carrier protein] reductase